MVICLERGADLHMAQLMSLTLTVSCFSKIQIGFTFLVPAHLVLCVCLLVQICICISSCTLQNHELHFQGHEPVLFIYLLSKSLKTSGIIILFNRPAALPVSQSRYTKHSPQPVKIPSGRNRSSSTADLRWVLW